MVLWGIQIPQWRLPQTFACLENISSMVAVVKLSVVPCSLVLLVWNYAVGETCCQYYKPLKDQKRCFFFFTFAYVETNNRIWCITAGLSSPYETGRQFWSTSVDKLCLLLSPTSTDAGRARGLSMHRGMRRPWAMALPSDVPALLTAFLLTLLTD